MKVLCWLMMADFSSVKRSAVSICDTHKLQPFIISGDSHSSPPLLFVHLPMSNLRQLPTLMLERFKLTRLLQRSILRDIGVSAVKKGALSTPDTHICVI